VPMEFCHNEERAFPASQFTTTGDIRMHTPPGKEPHEADPTKKRRRTIRKALRARKLRRGR
jgi:hypothetical protein